MVGSIERCFEWGITQLIKWIRKKNTKLVLIKFIRMNFSVAHKRVFSGDSSVVRNNICINYHSKRDTPNSSLNVLHPFNTLDCFRIRGLLLLKHSAAANGKDIHQLWVIKLRYSPGCSFLSLIVQMQTTQAFDSLGFFASCEIARRGNIPLLLAKHQFLNSTNHGTSVFLAPRSKPMQTLSAKNRLLCFLSKHPHLLSDLHRLFVLRPPLYVWKNINSIIYLKRYLLTIISTVLGCRLSWLCRVVSITVAKNAAYMIRSFASISTEPHA